MSGPPSGIKLEEETLTWFNNNMKLKRKNQSQEYRCMVMTIKGDKVIKEDSLTFEKTDNQRADFDRLVASLPKESASYIILDMTASSKCGQNTGKDVLFLITWCPDTLKTKEKMCCAATKNALVEQFKGTKPIQINDICDFTYDEMMSA